MKQTMMPTTETLQQAALARFARAIRRAARPDRRTPADEWAEQHRILPEDTPEPGPFRCGRTPWVVDIMRTMSPGSPWVEGWWMKPHQIGGSVSGENLIGTWICEAAGSMLVVFPTLDDAKQWELQRFEPMRASTRALRLRIRGSDAKGSDNTKLRKKYPGGVMRLIGVNRMGAMKSSTIRYIKFEEPDEYPLADVDQGSVIGNIKKRTSNYGRKAKIYGDGTPTVDGRSNIQRQVLRGDRRKWFMHCPDCGHAQVMRWEQLRWQDGDTTGATALYYCEAPACGVGNTEAAWKERNYRPRTPGMTESEAKESGRGYWEATALGEPGVASWLGLEALAAPLGWRPWAQLVIEWQAARGNEDDQKSFVNNHLARPWVDTVRSEVDGDTLAKRAEQYQVMSCPPGGLVATAGIDTQDNRLAIVVRCWGRGEESWGAWHGEIYGSPADPATWLKLRSLLESPIQHANGQVMHVDAAAIDAGGHHGEDVYAFTRDAQARGKHWIAVRGAKAYDAPKLGRPKRIEFTWRGTPVPGGAEVRFIGTQAIKNLIDSRLRLGGNGGGGYYHFPLPGEGGAFGREYFQQLRSERREWRRDTQGHKALWWVCPSGVRNEAWDCEVYAYAAYLYAMSGRHAESVLRDRERVYGVRAQLELLDDGAPRPTQRADAASGAAQAQPELQAVADLPPITRPVRGRRGHVMLR